MKKCSVETCQTLTPYRHFCRTHLNRFKKYGDPLGRYVKYTNAICIADGCDMPRAWKCCGYCSSHYGKLRKYGDAQCPKPPKVTSSDLILAALRCVSDDCLVWPMSVNRDGYGKARFKGKQGAAHRFVCEQANGPRPFISAQAAHSCRNPRCYNPKHIRWATPLSNSEDKKDHGTVLFGDAHPRAKINSLSASQIIDLYAGKMPIAEIAKLMQCSYGAAYMICKNQTWKHLARP